MIRTTPGHSTSHSQSVPKSAHPAINLLRALSGLGIGGFFLWLTLRQTSLEQVKDILAQSHSGWIAVAIVAYGLNLTVRVIRWRTLLEKVKALSFKAVGTALVIGYAMNNILPARLGELFRANFAGKRYRAPRSAIFGSIFVERTLDGLIVVTSLVLGRLFITNHALLNSLTIASIFLFGGIFIVLWLLSRGIGQQFLVHFPAVIATKINNFCQGLGAIQGDGFGITIAWSLLIWLLEGIAHWSILQALHISVGLKEMLSVVGVVNLSTLLPSAPGFVGTYQYAYAFTLGLFGFQSEQGVAAATAVQIFLLGSTTIVGLGLYIYLRIFKPIKEIRT